MPHWPLLDVINPIAMMDNNKTFDAFALARAEEAKALALLAFRNGPVESMHAGVRCQSCEDDESYSRLTDAQMKTLNKYMVDRLYELLTFKETDREEYNRMIAGALPFTTGWDDPSGLPNNS
jgi:hypothetical protein